MKVLICMDTDGTFWTDEINSEYVCGIIDSKLLFNKIWREGLGYEVVIVSESPYYPKNKQGGSLFTVVNDQASRYYNLVKAKEDYTKDYGKPDLCIYVDDQYIWRHDAEEAGFIFSEVNLFADMMGVRHE